MNGAIKFLFINTGKGFSTLKERPKSKPHVNQKSRVGCQIMDLKLWTASRGEIKVFSFFRALLWKAGIRGPSGWCRTALGTGSNHNTPYTYHRLWETCTLSQTLGRLDHLCYQSDILSDHWHNYLSVFWGSHLCTAIHWFLYQKQEDCNPNGQTLV